MLLLLFVAAWSTEQLLAPLGAPERERAEHLQALGERMHAQETPLERFCTAQHCALDGFFDKLAALSKGEGNAVRIVHIGDSQIASDYITDVTRRRLSLRFGSAGRGFLFIDKPSSVGRTTRSGAASEGWRVVKIPAPRDRGGIYGFTGVNFFADDGRLNTHYSLGDTQKAELYYLATPKAGSVEVSVDDEPIGEVSLRADTTQSAVTPLPLADGKTLTLKTRGSARLFGVVFENGQPGITYDAIGVPGSDFDYVLQTDETVFVDQLQKRAPALVILQLAGAEVYGMTRGWTTPARVEEKAIELVQRVRKAAPQSECLLIGPLSRGSAETAEPLQQTAPINVALRSAAEKSGCAFWSALDAMGGVAAAVKWHPRAMMNKDLVHPRGDGADLIGQLFELAIVRSYAESGRPWPTLDLGLKGALPATAAKLRVLDETETGRFAVLQLGASHTSAQMFTDEARKQLQERFGNSGRGFVDLAGAQAPWSRAKISRKRSGNWHSANALRHDPGVFGLTGVRYESTPGAALALDFCVGCPRTHEDRASIDLFYLDGPLQVLLDGKRVTPKESGKAVKRMTLDVRGLEHTLQVRSEDKMTLLGAAIERDTPGIVYDSLGLPGSTAFDADGYDKAAFTEQLAARRADLYVLFYGANEATMKDLSADDYASHYRSLLATLKAASPQAECLILGNSDRAREIDGRWMKSPSQDLVDATLRQVATSAGCAFWSTIANMGGPGAVDRWARIDEPYAKRDRVHMSKLGYEAMARRLVKDLLVSIGR